VQAEAMTAFLGGESIGEYPGHILLRYANTIARDFDA
jgi:hypothetical protein